LYSNFLFVPAGISMTACTVFWAEKAGKAYNLRGDICWQLQPDRIRIVTSAVKLQQLLNSRSIHVILEQQYYTLLACITKEPGLCFRIS